MTTEYSSSEGVWLPKRLIGYRNSSFVSLTQVLVLGEFFRHPSRLACRFGPLGVDSRMVVPAIFLNSSALLCVSPPRLTLPEYPVSAAAVVEVTNNAAVGGIAAAWSTFSRSGVAFQYEAAPEINSVVPHLGPASGNFSVIVAGGPFPDTPELRYAVMYRKCASTIFRS